MQPGISTHLFLQQRLTAGMLETLSAAGAQCIEVFASRHHFDYTDRGAIKEIATWFRSNDVEATMHMPLFTVDEESQWSRHTAPTLNLIDSNKSARIEAMDEVKRALEAAEQVPFRSCILHLGRKDDEWNTRSLDDSLTAIEHLKAFAGPLGVQLLLENLSNAFATPSHLVEIVQVGHFQGIGFCLDTGHAHLAELSPEWMSNSRSRLQEKFGGDVKLTDGIVEAFEVFGDRLVELHLHDNGGTRDEHAWPGEVVANGLDWGIVRACMQAITQPIRGILEIAYGQEETAKQISGKCTTAWRLLELANERA